MNGKKLRKETNVQIILLDKNARPRYRIAPAFNVRVALHGALQYENRTYVYVQSLSDNERTVFAEVPVMELTNEMVEVPE